MMSDQRVHPTTAAVDTPPPPPASSSDATSPKHAAENPAQPPPPTTHVVLFPKEQVLRYPPPDNARKFQALSRRKSRRSCCRRCFCYTLCLLLLLIVAAAISAGVLYLVFRFKSPKYTVTNLAINGVNVTSAAPISPRFNVTIRAENPNGKIGIDYLRNSSVRVFYNDLKLSDGVFPAFYQPKKNQTLMQTSLRGSDVVLGGSIRTSLRNAQREGRVPLVVRVRAPVKIKVGSVKTWEITFRIKCDVVVDELNPRARIVSTDCDHSVRLW